MCSLYLIPHQKKIFFFLFMHFLVCQIERQLDLVSEPPHFVPALFFLQADSTFLCSTILTCIPFRSFSSFCVRPISFSSLSFKFLMACQSWLKISSFEVVVFSCSFVHYLFHGVVDYYQKTSRSVGQQNQQQVADLLFAILY